MTRSEPNRTSPRPAGTPGLRARAPGAAATLLCLMGLLHPDTTSPARAASAAAPAAPHYLRGLVPLPGLDRRATDATAAMERPPDALAGPRVATLMSAPSVGIGTVVAQPGLDELATTSSGPDGVGALVFDVAGTADEPWYLLARQRNGRVSDYGWYRAGPTERLRPYETLLADGLAFMRNGWDGHLYATPTDTVPHRIVPRSRGGAVRVADAWMDAEDPAASWLLIVVFVQDSVCTDEWPVVVASGWVRAYRPDADPAAWFHAAGC